MSEVSIEGVTITPNVAIEQVTITPEMAKKMLETNTKNRNIREALVQRFTRDITAGSWRLNGETIKFSKTGVLLDGQHRLEAVVKANKPITTLVVTGLDDEAQATVDAGVARTFSDRLQLRGERHYSTLSAMVRLSLVLDVTGGASAGNRGPSSTEMTNYLDHNPELRDYTTIGIQAPRSAIRLPGSIAGAVAFQMARIDKERAVEFWRQLLENDAKKGSAVFVLRDHLVKNNTSAHRWSPAYRTALVIKAWNYWVAGREVVYINWKAGVEDFPRLMAPSR